MTIDLARELTVRCIAHNLGLRYPSRDIDRKDVVQFALSMAGLMTGDATQVATAAVALWEATDDPDPIHINAGGDHG